MPPVPTNLTAVPDQAGNRITLAWDDIPGHRYRLRSQYTGRPGVTTDHGIITTPGSRRGPLADDHRYTYQVTSVAADGSESAPASVTATLGTAPVDPPPTEPPPGGGVPVGSREVFRGDYGATGGFGQWSNIQTQGYNGSGSGFRGNDRLRIVDMGPGHETAARHEVRPRDSAAGGERCEVRPGGTGTVRAGDERWYQMSVLFPGDFPAPANSWFIVMQWHAGSGSPPLSLEVSPAGELRLHNNRAGRRTVIGTITKGRWMNLVLHVKFSTGSDAYAEAWINGTKSAGVHRHPNMAGTENYLKQGIYRGGQSTTHVVYHDGLRITAP